MATTIHGWPIIASRADGRLRNFKIPGVPSRSLLLRSDVGPYLVAFAAEYDKKIASIDGGIFDDWSYTEPRLGRMSSKISDHSGGVAIDVNSAHEGSQSASTLTWWRNPIRRAKLAALRKRYPLLEWGGDYSPANRDPMHWTFKYGVTASQVVAASKAAGIDRNGVRK